MRVATVYYATAGRRAGRAQARLWGRAWATPVSARGVVRVSIEEPMDDETGAIAHPKFRIWLRQDGIVQLVWAPRSILCLEDATAALEGMAQLTGGRRSPLLVDMRETGQLDRPARAEFASRSDLHAAVALVVGTPLSRATGNFFLRVSKPLFPTRLFDNEASAVAWLRAYVS
jgi:hypothetical protein